MSWERLAGERQATFVLVALLQPCVEENEISTTSFFYHIRSDRNFPTILLSWSELPQIRFHNFGLVILAALTVGIILRKDHLHGEIFSGPTVDAPGFPTVSSFTIPDHENGAQEHGEENWQNSSYFEEVIGITPSGKGGDRNYPTWGNTDHLRHLFIVMPNTLSRSIAFRRFFRQEIEQVQL